MIDRGDTAWILTSTALVLFMTIPGLSLFYAGLVRTQNVLSVLMQCFVLTAMIALLWLAYGYSFAFDTSDMQAGVVSLHSFVGTFEKAFLRGVGVDSISGTIPEPLFLASGSSSNWNQRPPRVQRLATREDASGLDRVERRGREIFEHDLAADRAGDAVLRSGYFASSWNWIVVRQENGLLVRYINDEDSVFADVLADVSSTDLERVTIHDTPMALFDEQLETWRARVAAVALARKRELLKYSEHYSWVVLPALEPNRSRDVYLLPSSRDPRIFPQKPISR